jgi:uncharacterized protein YjbJ (UPF0337 family)
MKPRTRSRKKSSRSEMKGVVKKMAGKLTSDPAMEQQGREEMLGGRSGAKSGNAQGRGRKRTNPDPYRHG